MRKSAIRLTLDFPPKLVLCSRILLRVVFESPKVMKRLTRQLVGNPRNIKVAVKVGSASNESRSNYKF